MNDNHLQEDYIEPPDWVWDIVDKHDLALRSESPLSAATALLVDASDILKHAALESFRQQAMTSETISRAQQCAEMIADAVKLSELCPSTPIEGIVTKDKDGTLSVSEVDNVHYL